MLIEQFETGVPKLGGGGYTGTESLLRPSFGVLGLRMVSIVSWWGAVRAGLEVPHMDPRFSLVRTRSCGHAELQSRLGNAV